MDSESNEVNRNVDGENNIAVTETDTPENEKMKRRLRSNVWNHFKKLMIDGKEKTVCDYCSKDYLVGSSKYGTSHLTRHVVACMKRPKDDISKLFINHEGKLQANKIDHSVVREMIARCIIEHDLPFSFVEYKRVRELFKYLNIETKFISRNTAANDVWKFYEGQKRDLKNTLASIPSRICLTSDVWTACTTEGYICLTAHYVDEKWKLNSKILSFCSMPPPHSGYELSKKVLESIKEWGIEEKIFSLTLDNSSANDCMQDILKSQLCIDNSLLCEGEFFHVRCSAHILNLIVQEGLKVASDALHKIRESVKYVKSSEGRMKGFQDCVRKAGIQWGVGLRLDVPTRWNSTFTMLKSALKYRRAFSNFQILDRSYKHCPSLEEWTRGEKMCDFLKPFYNITNMFSGSTYPTSNLYFMQIWKIKCLLKANLESEDEVIRDMACRMSVKFSKYWEDYSTILAIGTVLDPMMKFGLLEYCYEKLDPNTSRAKIKCVKEKLYLLFDQYQSKSTGVRVGASSNPNMSQDERDEIESDDTSMDVYEEYLAHVSQNIAQNGKSALDMYLEEGKFEVKSRDKSDVLQYWKDYRQRFGELSLMACDVLSIPITTVASESAFSIGARVLNKYRSCLLLSHVQALICSRNWLLGYVPPEDDENEEDNQTIQIVDPSGPSPTMSMSSTISNAMGMGVDD